MPTSHESKVIHKAPSEPLGRFSLNWILCTYKVYGDRGDLRLYNIRDLLPLMFHDNSARKIQGISLLILPTDFEIIFRIIIIDNLTQFVNLTCIYMYKLYIVCKTYKGSNE